MSVPLAAIRVTRRVLDALLVFVVVLALGTIALSRIVPALSDGTLFVVKGGSMEPAIPLGAAVLVRPVDASDLRVGDIVSVKVGPDRTVFTHRIIRIVPRSDGLWLETKGDANPTADPSIIPAADVIGRATTWLPMAGYVVSLLGSLSGVGLLLSTGSVLLIASWLLDGVEDGRRLRTLEPATDPADGARAGEPRVGLGQIA